MKNTKLMESPVNKTFEEILVMDDDSFTQWVIDLRETVVDLWDNEGLPPKVGYSKEEIIDNFKKMIAYPVNEIEIEKDVIRNTTILGNAVNEWFPTMMKTKISYSSKGNAKSIYDYFKEPDLLETFITYAKRHFKRDSFYHYSNPISVGDVLTFGQKPYVVTTPEEFRDWFEKNGMRNKSEYDYWLCPVKEKSAYSGYNTDLSKKQNLFVDGDFKAPQRCKTNVDKTRSNKYSIRLYKRGQKLFPIGLKAFRVSFCQYAVNFPPLTARYLYERFTKHIPKNSQVYIYDPSMGWGGRLVGALSSTLDRNVCYVGTDPNTDHNISHGVTKYHQIGEFFNKNVRISGSLFGRHHKFDIFQDGSEVISENPKFQKYKGKLDLVFTSPPYFNKEVYSDDEEQSCHKFENYEAWRDGFLKPTLATCVEYLKHDRYLLWNIANIVLAGNMLPLEEDSKKILEDLGMQYVTTIKMTLAQMPGSNRLEETGEIESVRINTVFGEITKEVPVTKGQMKNFVKIKDKKNKNMMLKYEPIFCYYKP